MVNSQVLGPSPHQARFGFAYKPRRKILVRRSCKIRSEINFSGRQRGFTIFSSTYYWPSFVIFDIRHSGTQGWASECPDVKNYKWRLITRSGTGCFMAVRYPYGNSGRQRVKARRLDIWYKFRRIPVNGYHDLSSRVHSSSLICRWQGRQASRTAGLAKSRGRRTVSTDVCVGEPVRSSVTQRTA